MGSPARDSGPPRDHKKPLNSSFAEREQAPYNPNDDIPLPVGDGTFMTTREFDALPPAEQERITLISMKATSEARKNYNDLDNVNQGAG